MNVPLERTSFAPVRAQEGPHRNQGLQDLESAWEQERKQYLIEGQNGRRHVPSRHVALMAGVLGQVVCWPWLVIGLVSHQLIASLMAVALLVISTAYSFFAYRRAFRYERAYNRYLQRREEMVLRTRTQAPTSAKSVILARGDSN